MMLRSKDLLSAGTEATIGAQINFRDSSGLNYRGTVVDVRDGVVFAAVLGYSAAFGLQQCPDGSLFFDRMVGQAAQKGGSK